MGQITSSKFPDVDLEGEGTEKVQHITDLLDELTDNSRFIENTNVLFEAFTKPGPTDRLLCVRTWINGYAVEDTIVSYSDNFGLAALFGRIISYVADGQLKLLSGIFRKMMNDMQLIHDELQKVYDLQNERENAPQKFDLVNPKNND